MDVALCQPDLSCKLLRSLQRLTAYSLFTLSKPPSPLWISWERGFLRVNRQHIHIIGYPASMAVVLFLSVTRPGGHLGWSLKLIGWFTIWWSCLVLMCHDMLQWQTEFLPSHMLVMIATFTLAGNAHFYLAQLTSLYGIWNPLLMRTDGHFLITHESWEHNQIRYFIQLIW